MIRAILTDIEGTTSSLSFVQERLIPYARTHLAGFVRENREDPQVQHQLDAVRRVCGAALDEAAVVDQLLRWMDEDRKIAPLKQLQGMIWEAGYRNGELKGHVYEDTARRLRAWHEAGLGVYAFSSGSVQAQKLLFEHSTAGDLSGLFSGYFDIRTGGKRDPEAYWTIAKEIAVDPEEILFLSDTRKELDAAREAGMVTCWLVRDHDPNPTAEHNQVRDFDAVNVG